MPERDEPRREAADVERSWAERLRDELLAAADRRHEPPSRPCARGPRPRARRG